MKEAMVTSNLNSLMLDLSFNLSQSSFLPVIMCISLNNSNFSKYVAEYLLGNKCFNGFIYGRAGNPITENNFKSAIKYIKGVHPKSKIIVVVNKTEDFNEKIYYGAGLIELQKYKFGDYCIFSIFDSCNKILGIKNIKENFIAKAIAEKIVCAEKVSRQIKNFV